VTFGHLKTCELGLDRTTVSPEAVRLPLNRGCRRRRRRLVRLAAREPERPFQRLRYARSADLDLALDRGTIASDRAASVHPANAAIDDIGMIEGEAAAANRAPEIAGDPRGPLDKQAAGDHTVRSDHDARRPFVHAIGIVADVVEHGLRRRRLQRQQRKHNEGHQIHQVLLD
jgi:hypothetical protein